MSLIHIYEHAPGVGAFDETSLDSSIPNESDFVLVEGEVRGLPPPSTRLGVDPRLETPARMINAIEEKQGKLFPKLKKLPEMLEKEADYSNKQINHLVAKQDFSKKYLIILTGAVAVLATIAATRLAHMGVDLWKQLRKDKSTLATKLEGTKGGRRRLHQRDWRKIEAS